MIHSRIIKVCITSAIFFQFSSLAIAANYPSVLDIFNSACDKSRQYNISIPQCQSGLDVVQKFDNFLKQNPDVLAKIPQLQLPNPPAPPTPPLNPIAAVLGGVTGGNSASNGASPTNLPGFPSSLLTLLPLPPGPPLPGAPNFNQLLQSNSLLNQLSNQQTVEVLNSNQLRNGANTQGSSGTTVGVASAMATLPSILSSRNGLSGSSTGGSTGTAQNTGGSGTGGGTGSGSSTGEDDQVNKELRAQERNVLIQRDNQLYGFGNMTGYILETISVAINGAAIALSEPPPPPSHKSEQGATDSSTTEDSAPSSSYAATALALTANELLIGANVAFTVAYWAEGDAATLSLQFSYQDIEEIKKEEAESRTWWDRWFGPISARISGPSEGPSTESVSVPSSGSSSALTAEESAFARPPRGVRRRLVNLLRRNRYTWANSPDSNSAPNSRLNIGSISNTNVPSGLTVSDLKYPIQTELRNTIWYNVEGDSHTGVVRYYLFLEDRVKYWMEPANDSPIYYGLGEILYSRPHPHLQSLMVSWDRLGICAANFGFIHPDPNDPSKDELLELPLIRGGENCSLFFQENRAPRHFKFFGAGD